MIKKGPRSSPYPSYSIQYCLELVTKIYLNFGSGNYFAKREEIAKVLGVSEAHMQTQVSSATQYGLLELKQGQGYKPSDLFRKIYKPLDENSKNEALVSVFKSPHLYLALINTFENEILPAIVPLTNILIHHHSISDAAADKAASIFIDNANHFGYIDENNILTFSKGSSLKKEDLNDENDQTAETDIDKVIIDHILPKSGQDLQTQPNVIHNNSYQNSFNEFSKPIPFNIPLKGNRTAQIVVPSDVKTTDFDFIINFINLMKQQYD